MDDHARAADGLRFGCPGCGSGLRYDIASGRMRCDSCGQQYDVSAIPDPSRDAGDGMMEAAEYRCPQCGAAVHTSQTAATSFCSYCGADVILTQRLTRVMRPAQLVPFHVSREECENIYRKRVKESRYAPDDFAAQETIGHFRPVYVPFWRMNGKAAGDNLAGSATHTHSDSRYDYSDQYSYTVAGSVAVSGAIYDASVSFEDETAEQLRFSAQRAVDFHPAYLCGFYAETPDTEPSLFGESLRENARKAWNNAFVKRVKMGDAKVAFPDSSFSTGADLLLMPVWLLAHRSGGRVVYTAVNGDTGEIVCDTPVSNRRFGVLAAQLTVLALALLVLMHFVVILRPRLLAALCGLTAAMAQWVIARVFRDLRIRQNRENDYTWQQLHPDPRTGRVKRTSSLSRRAARWYTPLAVVGGISLIGMCMAYMSSYNFNAFLAGLLSDHAWLPTQVQICSLAMFLFSRWQRGGGLDGLLYIGRLAAMIVTLLLIQNGTADLYFYLCCIAQLLLTALSMARLNKAHNAFVSRPVPFVGEEAEQA
ncbi:MAG: hypothetical protein IJ157_02020 [Clostridia bacterium]|nr:hypothetical protein [Clostridia bacterium]